MATKLRRSSARARCDYEPVGQANDLHGLRVIPSYGYETEDGEDITVGARIKDWWRNDPLPATWNVNVYTYVGVV